MESQKLKNEVTTFGFRCTGSGFIQPEEARQWFKDLKELVRSSGKSKFGLLVDVRSQVANPPETTEIIQEAMSWLKQAGVERSAVVLDNPMQRLQITRLAKASGAYAWERYFDASADGGWESKALAWIVLGKDPDK